MVTRKIQDEQSCITVGIRIVSNAIEDYRFEGDFRGICQIIIKTIQGLILQGAECTEVNGNCGSLACYQFGPSGCWLSFVLSSERACWLKIPAFILFSQSFFHVVDPVADFCSLSTIAVPYLFLFHSDSRLSGDQENVEVFIFRSSQLIANLPRSQPVWRSHCKKR